MTTPSWLPPGWFPGDSLPIVPGTATGDIIGLISRRCRRAAPDGSNFQVEIISEMVHAQRKLEEGPTLPWFLKRSATVVVAANSESLGYGDTGFPVIRLQDDVPLAYIHPDGGEPIEIHQEAELKILRQKWPGSGEFPKEFYVENDVIILRPVPTQQLNYIVRFYHNDVEPILGAATQWTRFFPDMIMNLAGYEIAWSLGNERAADRFAKGLQISRDKFVKAVTAREEAGQTHIMGDD